MSLSAVTVHSSKTGAGDDQADDLDEGYASVHGWPVMANGSEVVDEPNDAAVVAEDDEVVQIPQAHPEPHPPAARE